MYAILSHYGNIYQFSKHFLKSSQMQQVQQQFFNESEKEQEKFAESPKTLEKLPFLLHFPRKNSSRGLK